LRIEEIVIEHSLGARLRDEAWPLVAGHELELEFCKSQLQLRSS